MGYGLCGAPDKTTHLNIALLQTYLQQRAEASRRASRSSSPDIIGQIIDDEYEIQSLVSGSGGFADVYKAARRGGTSPRPEAFAAIKVLRGGQLSILEREVETLQAISHRNIVQVLGSGRLPDGRVYLAMEYLDGQPLRSYCSASARPSEPRLLSWAADLLDALYHMHPKQREIREIRLKRARSADAGESFRDLLAARYGYVHRDIKPENIIITGRGPVLIDFNISVKASSPIVTYSATPGYLPDTSLGSSWSPTVDLYQLGLTLLQAASGAGFTGDNKDDLLVMAADVCGRRTMDILKNLLEAHSRGYKSAYTARRAAVAARSSL
jgi:serine/threonine-protein kinase